MEKISEIDNYQIDDDELQIRREIDREKRSFWEKIIFIDLGVLGIVLPLVISSDSFLRFPKFTYSLFLTSLILGVFLVLIDNKRRLFVLDFADVITREMERMSEDKNDDNLPKFQEILNIEKRFGLFHIDKYPELQKFLISRNKLHHKRFMRFLYFIEPILIFLFYFCFVGGIIFLNIGVFLR